MAYTAAQLITIYTQANGGIAPDAATALLLTAYADQDTAGTLTDQATLSAALHVHTTDGSVINSPQTTTDVALATYEFFSGVGAGGQGTIPTAAGLSYLVNNPTANPNGLGSAYYAKFNENNRYINFSVNLATGSGAYATAFATNYGALSFAQVVSTAYAQIVGAPQGAAAAAAAVAYITSQQSYFTSFVAQYAPSANQALAADAAVIGYIMSAALQADIGIYATAIDGFQNALAVTGTAAYGANILSTYGTTPVPVSFALTTGVDAPGVGAFVTPMSATVSSSVVGTFNGTATNVATYNAGDQIVAPNLSTGNSLTLADLGTGGTGAPTAIAATVGNIQTVNILSGEAITANTASSVAGFAGLTQLNITDVGGTTATAAATTSVSVTDSAAAAATESVVGGLNINVAASGVTGAGTITVGAAGSLSPAGTVTVVETVQTTSAATIAATDAINVTGGTTISVTANLLEAAAATLAAGVTPGTVTGGVISITGSSATTAVTVTESAAQTAAAGALAVAAVPATVAAIAAAPGLQAQLATTQTKAVAAAAGKGGVADGAINILDANFATTAAGTIKTVTLSNAGAGSTISDSGLTTLSLTGSTVTLTTNAGAAIVPTLALTVSGTSGLTDTNHEITTLNVAVASSTGSKFALVDTGLTTLNVSGAGVLTLTAAIPTTVTTLAVSGSAGFTDNAVVGGATGAGVAADTALTTGFTTTSSGVITAQLNAATQSFTGSTGQDIITIYSDAAKTIKGGTATNNEIVLDASSATFNATVAGLTNANVTGFTTLGLGVNSSGTWVMNTLNPGFNAVDVTAAAAAGGNNSIITQAATGTSLSIDAADANNVSLSYIDTTGATDTTKLTLGTTALGSSTFASIALQDANGVGVNTINLVSNGSDAKAGLGGAINTITTLVDNGLSVLNVTGAAGLTVTTLNEASHQATSLTINSGETGVNGTTIGTLTDIQLGNLTFSGTNAGTVNTLAISAVGSTVTNLTIANTGTGTATVGAFNDAGGGALLTTLNLNGNVTLGPDALPNATVNLNSVYLTNTAGVTVSGATDNAHVTIALSGAAVLNTDTITLGNANNSVYDASLAGTVKVTVGTGSDMIWLGDSVGTAGSTLSGAAYTVTLGAHNAAGPDFVAVADLGTTAFNSATTVITGAVAGDQITFSDTGPAVLATLTSTQLSNLTTSANVAAAITLAETYTAAAHGVVAFTYAGNTYAVETLVANTAAATSTVVELVGVHTVSAGSSTITGFTGHGAITLLS